jgi:hypothetical protein
VIAAGGTDLHDLAGKFMTHDVWQDEFRLRSFPCVEVRAADAAGTDLDDGTIAWAFRIGDRFNGDGFAAGVEQCGFHGLRPEPSIPASERRAWGWLDPRYVTIRSPLACQTAALR